MTVSPTIRVDDQVYKELQGRAEPFIDTPNSVMRRVLGLDLEGETTERTDDLLEEAAPQEAVRRVAGRGSKGQQAGRPKPKDRRARAKTGTLLRSDRYELPLLE